MAIRSDSGRAGGKRPARRTGFRAVGPMLLVLLALLVVWGLFTLFGGDDEEPAAPAAVPAGTTDTVTGG